MFELQQEVVPLVLPVGPRDRRHGLQLRVLRQSIGHGCASMPGVGWRRLWMISRQLHLKYGLFDISTATDRASA
ncbi:hypothetical protein ACFRU3_42415 [Streptomyces sp. NPDC056910]|uniref:hypothetical protein n=1 Tax=Streptomyces sp. NPDC056910 TaxID=3345964 RepID=UPI00368015CC